MRAEPSSTGISLLLRAYEYAEDAAADPYAADPWQFALSVRELEAAGLTVTDVRWLLLKKLALLAREITTPGDPERLFRAVPFTALTQSTCIVLTADGAVQLRAKFGSTDGHAADTLANEPHGQNGTTPKPHWDPGRRELRLGDAVVKRFRVPAANQELVLQAFEEEGWPNSIDDPLPPVLDHDCQQRLRATIKSLNRSQQTALMRFHANGGGEVICWDLVRTTPGL
ncbi:MAG: hypothetical protein M3552_18535 [Planctomycetota bacterium]|nr:hypothetical protein [Planctomycetota bacterium]